MHTVAAIAAMLILSLVAHQTPAPVQDARPPFEDWLSGVRAEAKARGVRDEVIDQALGGVEYLDIVVQRDQTQAEFVLDIDQYLKRRLTSARIRNARTLAARHRPLLRAITAKYGVPSEILVAIWGLESEFGRFRGVRPTIPTLATLAYEPRRSGFFRGELFAALDIVNRGDIELTALKGSWAGAMGQPQFMPSTYLEHAVDFDKDGRRDIWNSLPDVFASMAAYLEAHGWTAGETWGREVRVPEPTTAFATAAAPRTAGCLAVRNMSQPLLLSEWQKLGVRLPNGRALPKAALEASLVRAAPRNFLVYRNYEALLAYNCAHTYALSVGLLADRIGGGRAKALPHNRRR